MKNLFQALLRVQGRVGKVKRDGKNPHFGNAYPTLEAVWGVLREPLTEEGLVVIQPSKGVLMEHGVVRVVTMVIHAESGKLLEFPMELPCPKLDPQGVGSATTYACRYSLMSIFGLAASDDDGEAARVDNPRQTTKTAPDGSPVPTLREAIESCQLTIEGIKEAIAEDDHPGAWQLWNELSPSEKMALWVAPSKGGPFTTHERTVIKSKPKEEAA